MKLLKTILFIVVTGVAHLNASTIVLFSPQDRPEKKLIELINNARTSIHAAVYMFTNKKIADALLQASRRGVEVKVIVDKATIESDYGKALVLKQGGIDIVVFNPLKTSTFPSASYRFFNDKAYSNVPLLHNKFAIFDKKIVFTGSFNWTVAANTRNQENVVVLDEEEVAKKYEAQFAFLFGNTSQKVSTRSLRAKEIDAYMLPHTQQGASAPYSADGHVPVA